MLKLQEERFAIEYCVDMNPKQAALRAGYSEKTAKYATTWLNPNQIKPNNGGVKYKPEVAQRIKQELEKIQSQKIAVADEVMEKLTEVLRGSNRYETVTPQGIFPKKPDARETLKAAELLAKRYNLLNENVNINANVSSESTITVSSQLLKALVDDNTESENGRKQP